MIIKSPPAYDVSHWKSIPDFTKINPKPYWMGTKASEGNYLTDDKFVPFFNGMAQIGCHRLAYHFHRKANTAKSQADKFISVVKPLLVRADTIALDVEEGGETAAQLREWIERVQNAFPQNLIIIYSRKNLLDPIRMLLSLSFSRYSALDVLDMTETDREFFRDIPTWMAGYPYNPDLFDTIPASYIPDQTKFGPVYGWQYSEKGVVPGIIGSVDLNLLSPLYIALLEGSSPPQGEIMPFFQATGSQVIREAGNSTAVVAKLAGQSQYILGPMSGNGSYAGDVIECDAPVGGYMKIKRLWRNGAWTQLPANAYCGTNYLKGVVFTPPPDPVAFDVAGLSVHTSLNLTFADSNGNVIGTKGAENVELV